MKMMKTYMAKSVEAQNMRQWIEVDATNKPLGRLAARVATILMGKHRPTYTPHMDTGDFVVVTNAVKIGLSGRKREQKEYQRYSGYPGGRKVISMARMLEKHPDDVIRLAVRRMMPKGALGNHMLKKLKVYAGPDHPHQAQQPEVMELVSQMT